MSDPTQPNALCIIVFLPRDAMLARYILQSCVHSFVCLSVCLSYAGTLRVTACVLFLCWTILRVNHSEPVALPAMGWDGHVPINVSFFDTHIYLVNIVKQNMYSFDFLGSQHSTAPNCHTNTMSTILRNWCQNRLHWKRSQFVVKSITPAKGVFNFFYKTWCSVFVSIWILEYFPGRLF